MYKELVRPVLDHLDSETWHVLARNFLHFAESNPITLKLLERFFAHEGKRFSHEKLKITLGGIMLDNPLLVGAGWDKPGKAIKALYQLGFAGVEVGSVLEFPQEGNPKPRQFMLSPGVALNRLGFNSPGMEAVSKNLEKYSKTGITIGISLSKNKIIPNELAAQTHANLTKFLYPVASYFVVNVSSPNTPNLRQLQDKGPLTEIVKAVNSAMDEKGKRKPLFVKIAPELTDAETDDVIDVVLSNGLTGIIATNTTVNPDIKAYYGEWWRNEAGGVSGNDFRYREMSTKKIEHITKVTNLKNIEIVGVGGVNSPNSTLEKIAAGAKSVQIVTGIRGEGTTLPGRINKYLIRWMKKEGINSIEEIVGVGRKNLPKITS